MVQIYIIIWESEGFSSFFNKKISKILGFFGKGSYLCSMKRTLLFFIIPITIGISPLSAQESGKEVDVQALYQQIDEAIEHSSEYVAKREIQIANVRKMLLSESSLEKRFAHAEQLFALYKPYKNDSALHFADLCILLADSLNRKDKVGLYLSLKAHQCSTAGLYVESLNLLKQVDKKALGPEELAQYYAAWMHVCGELGYYSQQLEKRNSYYNLQDNYRDSVLAVAETGSEASLHLSMDVLSARKQYQDALDVSDKWLRMVTDGTHESAYAAFYRSMVYDKLSNGPKVRYWLGKSALDDIKCAVFDQASLFMLADRLCKDGDYDRAYRYLHFCEDCNRVFSPQLRNYQVRYVADITDTLYQQSKARYSRLLIGACVGAFLLLVLVVWLFFTRRRAR